MAKRVQHVRHAGGAAAAFVGYIGEFTYDITVKTIRVHDGATPGGQELARADLDNVQEATATQSGKMSATHAAQIETNEAFIEALQSTQNNKGASQIAIEDAEGNYGQSNVEEALREAADLTNYSIEQAAAAQLAANLAQNGADASAKKANNLSDLGNIPTARQNLGLVIGTNVQAYSGILNTIVSANKAANNILSGDGNNWVAKTLMQLFTANGYSATFNSTSGELTLPGAANQRFKIKWGLNAAINLTGPASIPFVYPAPFPNATMFVLPRMEANTDSEAAVRYAQFYGVRQKSTAGCTLVFGQQISEAQDIKLGYIAFGY